MISRRPKRWASSEKPPGPSRIIETEMTTILTTVVRPFVKPPDSCGRNPRNIAAKQRPDTKPARGVKQPRTSAAPLRIRRMQSVNWPMELPRETEPGRHRIPSENAVVPTAARSNSSPIPGPPRGNVENDVCRIISCRVTRTRSGLTV